MRKPRSAAAILGSLALCAVAQTGCTPLRAGPPITYTQPAQPARTAGQEAYAALQYAWAQVGKRYCWGGTGPACFDCSGLVQSAWASVGVRLPRTADEIAAELPEVALASGAAYASYETNPAGANATQMRAGDILWWPGHVGLYAGNGWVVEALDRRHGVILRPMMRPPHRVFRPAG